MAVGTPPFSLTPYTAWSLPLFHLGDGGAAASSPTGAPCSAASLADSGAEGAMRACVPSEARESSSQPI
eukprot:11747833-Alexandrium_andersonii.AAC.1